MASVAEWPEGIPRMNPAVESRKEALAKLCRLYHVQELRVFGSAAAGDFDGESDFDFLVTFAPCRPGEHYERYFGLLEALEDLLGRGVDLVEASAISNPYFLRSVNQTRTRVYGEHRLEVLRTDAQCALSELNEDG